MTRRQQYLMVTHWNSGGCLVKKECNHTDSNTLPVLVREMRYTWRTSVTYVTLVCRASVTHVTLVCRTSVTCYPNAALPDERASSTTNTSVCWGDGDITVQWKLGTWGPWLCSCWCYCWRGMFVVWEWLCSAYERDDGWLAMLAPSVTACFDAFVRGSLFLLTYGCCSFFGFVTICRGYNYPEYFEVLCYSCLVCAISLVVCTA